MKCWWELGITLNDGSTQTIETFNNIVEALDGLKQCDDNSAFVDLWEGEEWGDGAPSSLDVAINKVELLNIINNKG